MATNFPTSLDALTNPTAVDTLDSPPHDVQHADANDAIEALQAKVGVDGSAVTGSLDYKVAGLTTDLNALGTRATFTPTWTSTGTQPALGNGTLVGEWVRVQNLVMVTYNLTMGSTTTFGTGNYLFSLPTAASDDIDPYQMQGFGVVTDVSLATNYNTYALYNFGSPDNHLLYAPSANTFISNTVPFTWASGDVARWKLVYCGA